MVIHTYKPVCVELYKDYKELGRFMLRYASDTIAAGVVTEVSYYIFLSVQQNEEDKSSICIKFSQSIAVIDFDSQ